MKLSDDMIKVCEMQGSYFESAQDIFGCGSGTFIYHFMFSKLARKMDNPNYSAFYDPSNHQEQLLDEYPSLNVKRGEYIDKSVMHWIGYIYRATSYIKEIPSRLLFKYMDYLELARLYNVYHTFGVDYCVERLSEHFNLDDKNTPDEKSLIKSLYKNVFSLL